MGGRTTYLLACVMAVATIAGGYVFTATMVANKRAWEESNSELSSGAVFLVTIADKIVNYWWVLIPPAIVACWLLAMVANALLASFTRSAKEPHT